MSTAYTPGLLVQENAQITVTRELPLLGSALVKVGDTVRSDTTVLSAELPGDVQVFRLAERMGFDPERIAGELKIHPGDKLSKGQLLLELKYFFGMFRSSFESPIDGTVEFFSETTAHLGVRGVSQPLTIPAYIDGVVTEVVARRSVTISATGAHLQGAFGVGGEANGTIHPLACERDTVVTPEILSGETLADRSIVIGGARFTTAALELCAERKVAGVITGSIDTDTLRNYIGYEVGVSMTGYEEIPFPLFITEGFGTLPISERFFSVATRYRGSRASINGQTQVRAGAIRPELIIPSLSSSAVSGKPPELTGGAKVRCIRTPYFGRFGTVQGLPPDPEKIESGAIVRVAVIALESGEVVRVPRANIELC